MCGRYALKASAGELISFFELAQNLSLFDLGTRAEFAPTVPVPIIRSEDDERRLAMVRWGLVPSWMKEVKSSQPLFNARGETVAEKPAFRASFKRKRCLVPASEFYEWKALIWQQKGKAKHRVALADGSLMALAGLWERWVSPEGEVIDSATIITCAPMQGSPMADLHDRMPVILRQDDWSIWLGQEQNPLLLQPLLRATEEDLVIEPA